ncbi:hypothetical protein L2E82_10334 [Cichorium intybus]|uniref:Uncharacterized protein n=1 Tax=Cichorium intybus TaxID=13427 RepID=A0ACB9GB98_CICIN|nr:hypothetical protein L2E82_10334 [Cichorium intybus]
MEGKTNFNAPIHKQQSMIYVNINTPGVNMIRPLMVFRFDVHLMDMHKCHLRMFVSQLRISCWWRVATLRLHRKT